MEMRMKKIGLSFVVALILGGCAASTGVHTKGVIVNVVEPPKQNPDSLQCNQDVTMSYVYVGDDTVKGNVTKSEKKLIASYAKAALKETSYITPVANKYDPGYDEKVFPIMGIDVIKNSIRTYKPRADTVAIKGVFIAQIDIHTPGSGVICKSSQPISIEIEYKEPDYKSNLLPSKDAILEEMVKEAVKRAVSTFVPVSDTILRKVKDGSGVIGESAKMIDANNCEMARDILQEYIQKHPNDDKAYYNLGVSYECMTKDVSKKQLYTLLQKALWAYTKAVRLKPTDKEYNSARKDIARQLKILGVVSQRSKEIKSYIKNFE